MRTRRFTTWLVLGIAVTLAYLARRGRRGRRTPWRRAAPPPPEPADQPGMSAVPADLDLDQIATSIDEVGGMHIEELGALDEVGEEAPAETPAIRRVRLGSGELYDAHVVSAADRDLPDDDRAQADGENWLERLEANAAELGPEPERTLDPLDDSDPHAGHHKTDRNDTPVADRGSAGPRGL
jgi:hypothetical protein